MAFNGPIHGGVTDALNNISGIVGGNISIGTIDKSKKIYRQGGRPGNSNVSVQLNVAGLGSAVSNGDQDRSNIGTGNLMEKRSLNKLLRGFKFAISQPLSVEAVVAGIDSTKILFQSRSQIRSEHPLEKFGIEKLKKRYIFTLGVILKTATNGCEFWRFFRESFVLLQEESSNRPQELAEYLMKIRKTAQRVGKFATKAGSLLVSLHTELVNMEKTVMKEANSEKYEQEDESDIRGTIDSLQNSIKGFSSLMQSVENIKEWWLNVVQALSGNGPHTEPVTSKSALEMCMTRLKLLEAIQQQVKEIHERYKKYKHSASNKINRFQSEEGLSSSS